MKESSILQSPVRQPSFEEIGGSIAGPTALLWQELNCHIQNQWKAAPKIMYSTCSGKPGWNVKYQKSGKSLCTLYPEPQGFVALVVIKLDLVPEVMARESEFTPTVIQMIANGKPYLGTLWLMIQVADERILNDVKLLLDMKTRK